MILYYSNQDANTNDDAISRRTQLLKQSLSKTLTHYYPLAGQMKDPLSVDCNDEGVYYVQARANLTLSEYLSRPDLTSLQNLMPRQASWYEQTSRSFVVMIQETTFVCGSLAIGVLVFHMIMDCYAAALQHRGNSDGSFRTLSQTRETLHKEICVDASSIDNLKVLATSSSVKNPTHVEVVSAFLFECVTAILKATSGIDRPTASSHVVNLRGKATPPIPESSFGNLSWVVYALSLPKETKLTPLVLKGREAIKKIESDFVKKIQGDGGFPKLYEMIKETGKTLTSTTFCNGVNFIGVTSWCGFGLYEVDFGWGKPTWASSIGFSTDATAPILNSIILMDSKLEKGIEAWVFMDKEDLVLLDKYEELLAYASINPSPMKLGMLVSHP
ncbi:transferase, putative [Ricinus communis]|uniref:Transferase, putative n=1 Tax=Ricinus communis TaxID=3988 RepID=B9RHW9_RICCO|nr:transferase, putative [Ricinus communis]